MHCAVGIDLGTTNSMVAVYRNGAPETIRVDGQSSMPSVVSFRPDGTFWVGRSAKGRMLINPENTIFSSKRAMGDRTKFYELPHKRITPAHIAAILLKRLVEDAGKFLCDEVSSAVIAVPSHFTEAQKEDTKKAGQEAGLRVVRLIQEPTAAAIACGLDTEKDQTILVYDLGGGTFDVSILQVCGNHYTAKAVGGDPHLGGDAFDQEIIKWAAARFREESDIDIFLDQGRKSKVAQQRLREAAEKAKMALSEKESAFIHISDCMGHPLNLELTLHQYNKLIESYILRTIAGVKRLLVQAEFTMEQIDRIILVGGSAKNRLVHELLAQNLKAPHMAANAEELVAHGAAMAAWHLFVADGQSPSLKITDVTAHSIGVETMDPHNGKRLFHPVIPRHTIYPCRRATLCFTRKAFEETVTMRVFRGENGDPANNTYLGDLQLPVFPPQKDNVPVGAVFELDADGILHCAAVQLPPHDDTRLPEENAHHADVKWNLSQVDDLVRTGKATTKTLQLSS